MNQDREMFWAVLFVLALMAFGVCVKIAEYFFGFKCWPLTYR